MSKEEVLRQIKNTEESIKELNSKMDKLKEELNEPESKRCEPAFGSIYYYLNSEPEVESTSWYNFSEDFRRYNIRNCFKTKEEAQLKADYIKTHYELMDIADELNAGRKIDWNNPDQNKYSLFFSFNYMRGIKQDCYSTVKSSKDVHCLSDRFTEIALSRIGEDRLRAYLTYSEQ